MAFKTEFEFTLPKDSSTSMATFTQG